MNFPKYLKIIDWKPPLVLRLNYNKLYYKDNGGWELRVEFKDNKFFAVGGYNTQHLDGKELIEATYAEYLEETGEKYAVLEDEDYEYKGILYDANPDCKHDVQPQWSGVKCIKCKGWFCA